MSLYSQLREEYVALAKKADQRMVRLEKLSKQEHFKGVLKYSYRRAAKDIEYYDPGTKKPRFNRNIPTNVKQLRARLADVKTFLDSITSSKSGILKVYQKRADTTNELYTTNFTWEDLANYYESDIHEKIDSRYGSKTVLRALATIKDNKKIVERIKKAKKKNIKLSDDKVVDEIAKQLIKEGVTL